MREDLPTMILLNMVLDTPQVENMEEELLYQVILNPISSTFLLREVITEITLSTRTQKFRKI